MSPEVAQPPELEFCVSEIIEASPTKPLDSEFARASGGFSYKCLSQK